MRPLSRKQRELLPGGAVRYTCDAAGCEDRIVVRSGEKLTPPWRVFRIDTWVGDFVACSDAHEARVRSNPDPR